MDPKSGKSLKYDVCQNISSAFEVSDGCNYSVLGPPFLQPTSLCVDPQ